MKTITLTHQAIRKLTLIGLLILPFVSTPGYTVELIGKPVARQSAEAASSTPSVDQQAPVAPAAAIPDEALPEPQVPEPPEINAAGNDIERAMDEVRNNFHEHDHSSLEDFMSPDIIIPIVAMSLLFGGPVILVIILAFLHYNAKARRQKNINMNIDKLLAAGRDIPLELLLGEEPGIVKSTNQTGDVVYTRSDEMMRKGIRNIGLGVGWLIFLTIMFSIKIGSFGFIIIGLGISQVVIWRLSDNQAPQVIDTFKAQD